MENYIDIKNFGRISHHSPKPEKFQRHFHAEYELYVFISGQADFIIENNVYNLQPYDVLLIKPFQYHILTLKNTEPYDRIVLNFTKEMLPDNVIPEDGNNFFKLSEKSEIIKTILNFNKATASYNEKDKRTAFNCTLANILLELKYYGKKPSQEQSYDLSPIIAKIIQYINDNLTEKLTIASMASALFISQSSLCHIFSSKMKISLIQFVRQKKIFHAHSLILSGVKPTAAAETCRFDTYSAFFRTYRNIIGKNPKEVHMESKKNPYKYL